MKSAALLCIAALATSTQQAHGWSYPQQLQAQIEKILDVFKWNSTHVINIVSTECGSRLPCGDAHRPGFAYNLSSSVTKQAGMIALARLSDETAAAYVINDAIPGISSFTPHTLAPVCATCVTGSEPACATTTPDMMKVYLARMDAADINATSIANPPTSTCFEFVTEWSLINPAAAYALVTDAASSSCALGALNAPANSYTTEQCLTLMYGQVDANAALASVSAAAVAFYDELPSPSNSAIDGFFNAALGFATTGLPVMAAVAGNASLNTRAYYEMVGNQDVTFRRLVGAVLSTKTVYNSDLGSSNLAVQNTLGVLCQNLFCADAHAPTSNSDNLAWSIASLSGSGITTAQAILAYVAHLSIDVASEGAVPNPIQDAIGGKPTACYLVCTTGAESACFTTTTDFDNGVDAPESLNCIDFTAAYLSLNETHVAAAKAAIESVATSACPQTTTPTVAQGLSNVQCGLALSSFYNMSVVQTSMLGAAIARIQALAGGDQEQQAISAAYNAALNNKDVGSLMFSFLLPTVVELARVFQTSPAATAIMLNGQDTAAPTTLPSKQPTLNPTTKTPTTKPTTNPTRNPIPPTNPTSKPTASPSKPTKTPTAKPTSAGKPTTAKPTTAKPTAASSAVSAFQGGLMQTLFAIALVAIAFF